MPRKSKTPSTERYLFCRSLSVLYSDRPAIDKLRADIFATTEKLNHQIIALRNTIPTADNSDARNTVQYIVDRATVKIEDLQSLIHSVGDRKIIDYQKIRKLKKKNQGKHQEQAREVKRIKRA